MKNVFTLFIIKKLKDLLSKIETFYLKKMLKDFKNWLVSVGLSECQTIRLGLSPTILYLVETGTDTITNLIFLPQLFLLYDKYANQLRKLLNWFPFCWIDYLVMTTFLNDSLRIFCRPDSTVLSIDSAVQSTMCLICVHKIQSYNSIPSESLLAKKNRTY